MYFSGLPTLRPHRYVDQGCRLSYFLVCYEPLAPICVVAEYAAHGCLTKPKALQGSMSTPAFLAAAVVLGLAGAFALIKHRSKKTIPRLPDAKLD